MTIFVHFGATQICSIPLAKAEHPQSHVSKVEGGTGGRNLEALLNDTLIPEDWEQALSPASPDKCR